MGPTRGAKWGKDFRSMTIALTLEEHRQMKLKSAAFGVPASEVARLAFEDDEMWQRAAERKAAAKQAREEKQEE